LWSLEESVPPRTLTGHSEAVVELAFSPDGATLASGGDDSTVRLWRVADGKLQRTLENHGHHVYAVGFNPDGHYLATGSRDHEAFRELLQNIMPRLSGRHGQTVRIWNVADGALVASTAAQNDVHGISFSPDGKLLSTASEDHTAMTWRVEY